MSLLDQLKGMRSRREVTTGLAAAAKVAKAKLDGLDLFRPTDYQEEAILRFEDATEMLIKGGTRSGKSVCAAAMVASYFRNKPITFADGSQHHVRELQWRDRPVVIWLVGLQLNHIGQTLHRLLCRPGAFDIVRDKVTGNWRAWQPGRIPGDEDIPVSQRKPAPPLIPKSEISVETWENKKEFKFTSMQLKNGSIAYGFASSGSVKRGDPINLLWADEEIEDSSHYPEWQSRLSDHKGRILWTSWPNLTTPALLGLDRRAREQDREVREGLRQRADAVRFTFVGSKSPFIDEAEKKKRAEGWTEQERLARDFGEFPTGNIAAYPEFDRMVHTVDYGPNNPLNDKITEAMRQLNWTVPRGWSVDLILDPGTQRPAMIFGAIPPKAMCPCNHNHYIVFKEIAVPRLDAPALANRVRATEPGRGYTRFIIDRKAGDQTPMGFSWKIREQYSKAMREAGLRCSVSGDMFIPGDHVWVSRSMKLRDWLRVCPECGRAKLRIVTHMCPNLVRQMEETLKAVTKDDVKDKLADGQVHDVLDCLEYWAGADPVFVVPPAHETADSPGLRMFENDRHMWDSLVGLKNKDSDKKSSTIVLGIP